MKLLVLTLTIIISSLKLTYAQSGNTSYGSGAGNLGYINSSFGASAGDVVTGSYNSFFGGSAGERTTSGNNNTFVGYVSGYYNSTGSSNSFFGVQSGIGNTTGSYNTYLGNSAGVNNATGNNNTFIGYNSGLLNTSGVGNIFLGYRSGLNETASNKLYIDNSDTSTPLIYGDFSTDVLTVNGKLGVGTPAPEAKFTISEVGNGWNDGLRINRDASNYLTLTEDVTDIRLKNWGSGGILFFTGSTQSVSILNNGNVGIAAYPSYKLQVQNAYCDGNTWYNASDKNLKKNFRTITGDGILDKLMTLKIERWTYKADSASADHIGPIAQDFNKTFGLGSNEKAISTVDEIGIALAAIQELNKKIDSIEELTKKVNDLEKLVTTQQQLIASITNLESKEQNEFGVKLFQNNPNPFSKDTEIGMVIPETVNQAILYIYSIEGKLIDKKAVTDRGVVKITIEGGSLSPGIYLYSLAADNFSTDVKRMLLTQ